jgi:hypothetical protein
MPGTAQTAERKELYRRIRTLTDSEAARVAAFVKDLDSQSHEPNEETAKALEESLNPENLTDCDDIDDMFKKCGVRC